MTNKYLFTLSLAFLFALGMMAQTETQTFTADGTFVVPDGVYFLNIDTWAGGGGGGKHTSNGAGGGAGGGYASGIITVAPGDMVMITVGAGGLGATDDNMNGADGGASAATHPDGSITATGGAGGTGTTMGGTGAGGTFAGIVDNQMTFNGGDGGTGASNRGGGGGGGAGDTSDGNNAAASNGGSGGTAGGGDGGDGGANSNIGDDGLEYGGGGGGGGRNANGGNGADGAVILTWISFAYAEVMTTTTFTANTVFTVPTTASTVDVQAWGGGGGGGQNGNGGGAAQGAGGGGGGGYAGGTLTVNSGDMITIVIGEGGTGANSNNTAGNPGSPSSVTHLASTLIANGGTGGTGLTAGGVGGGSTTAGVTNQVTFVGGVGGNGGANQGGGGGGGAGDADNGGVGASPNGGAGGNNNGGAGGNGGSNGAGFDGAALGGGGGGAGDDGGGGGDGADGAVNLTYICGTVLLSSASGTEFQTINNNALADITYTLSPNISGVTVGGLPTGVTGTFGAGVLTISGMPTITGTFNYTIEATSPDGCPPVTLNGVINVEVVLPVELLSFQAKKLEKTVLLNWETANELNNEKFIIEHSNDGQSFTAIGEVQGNGNSNETIAYQFVDQKPVAGINYYRLKQLDFDGQFAYSKLVNTFLDIEGNSTQLFPNPTNGKLSIRSASQATATVQVYNLNGILQLQQVFGEGQELIIDLANLPKGNYLIVVQQDNQLFQERAVKL